MRRRDLSRALLTCSAAVIVDRRADAASVATAGVHPSTAAERRAAVALSNLQYPPGDVRRYGAKGDGVTDDSAAFQAAINVARLPGGKEIYGPSGAGGTVYIPAPDVFYLLRRPLDCTFDGRANQHGIAFRADSGPSVDTPAIIACHTGHVFDLSGCDGATFENLNIGTDAAINPQSCFFLARNAGGGSAGYHRFRNVHVHGKFSVSVLYNYGSESTVYSECVWYNESSGRRTKVAIFTSQNSMGLQSTFLPIFKGSISCVDHQMLGGNFVNTSADDEADVLYLEVINSLKIFGPWMAAGVSGGGRAVIYVDCNLGPSSLCEIYGLQAEAGVGQKYGVCFEGRRATTPSGWTIDGCYLPSSKQAILAASSCTLDNFHIRNVLERASHGLCAEGVVQSSTINSGALPLSIGTSKGNVLIGDCSRWSIRAREHDSWMVAGAGNRTWTPGNSDLKIRGPLTVTGATCVFHGPMITLCATLTAAESIECPAGASLTGLPAPAIAKSALVSVCDGNTGAPLGNGMVAGSSITLPEISARRSIVISATYFAA